MWDFKKILGFLVLTSLMMVKVSAVHVYTHHDSETEGLEHCHLCEIAIAAQDAEFEFSEFQFEPKPNTQPASGSVVFLTQRKPESTTPLFLFSRPPPFSMA